MTETERRFSDVEIKEALLFTDEEWDSIGWEMRDWYRWLCNSEVRP